MKYPGSLMGLRRIRPQRQATRSRLAVERLATRAMMAADFGIDVIDAVPVGAYSIDDGAIQQHVLFHSSSIARDLASGFGLSEGALFTLDTPGLGNGIVDSGLVGTSEFLFFGTTEAVPVETNMTDADSLFLGEIMALDFNEMGVAPIASGTFVDGIVAPTNPFEFGTLDSFHPPEVIASFANPFIDLEAFALGHVGLPEPQSEFVEAVNVDASLRDLDGLFEVDHIGQAEEIFASDLAIEQELLREVEPFAVQRSPPQNPKTPTPDTIG